MSFGVSPASRGVLVVTRSTAYRSYSAIKVAEGGGGRLTAYLSSLEVATATKNSALARGMFDVSAMDECVFDIETMEIATGFGESALEDDNDRGVLSLPPGTGTVATATIGAHAGSGYGALILSNTHFTVTNSLTLNNTAEVTVNVTKLSSGINILNPAPEAFTIAENASLTVCFNTPDEENPFYGLRWKGDHEATIKAMIADGRLIVDDNGLGRKTSVFVLEGTTYLGLPPYSGIMVMFH